MIVIWPINGTLLASPRNAAIIFMIATTPIAIEIATVINDMIPANQNEKDAIRIVERIVPTNVIATSGISKSRIWFAWNLANLDSFITIMGKKKMM